MEAGVNGQPTASAPCRVIAFPPARRVAKIRRTARAILAQPTIERQDRIRHSVASGLFAELELAGLAESEQDEAVGAFFHAVELELYLLEDELLYAAPVD